MDFILQIMMRYLQHDKLVERRLDQFDSFASTFGRIVTAVELAPEGTGYRAKQRFSKFQNLPELMTMFREAADIKMADELDLPKPKVRIHNVVAQPSQIQTDFIKALSERAELVHAKKVPPTADNMLKITSDGRKVGLDPRLIDPSLPDHPGSKINMCVDNVERIWRENADKKSTQLVFCDFSTPADKKKEFNVYDDVKKKLIDKGIPANQIAFIHDAKNEDQKEQLFAKVRAGEIRVLLGSTEKMGAGTNVQDKLIAIHDLDAPWRPADLEQRKGRIARQGNENPEVEVYRYVTEKTFDAYLYQTLETKQNFISQVMTSKSPNRTCDDIDEAALDYAEVKALAAGDPKIKEKMTLDIEVRQLKTERSNFMNARYTMEDNVLTKFPARIANAERTIEMYSKDIAHRDANTHKDEKENFSPMKIGGETITSKEAAGKAILEAMKGVPSKDPQHIGEYRGFQMGLYYNFHTQKHLIVLKRDENSLGHEIEMGGDVFGNIQRLDNKLEAFERGKERGEELRAEAQKQYEDAKAEMTRPWPKEEELDRKAARLAELDVLLNLDSRGSQERSERDTEIDRLREEGAISEGVSVIDDEEPGVKLGKLLHATDKLLIIQTTNDTVAVIDKQKIGLETDTDKVMVGKRVRVTVDRNKERSTIASMERDSGGMER